MTIPPEIVDRIIDYLHDDPKTLAACSLVARDWVPSTRVHLFARLSLVSAREVTRFTNLDSFAPYTLFYCQELSIGTRYRFGNPSTLEFRFLACAPPLTIDGQSRFTSLHTLHLRGLPSGVEDALIEALVALSKKITTITFTHSCLESCYDLWIILRLFPNLEKIHVSDLGFSSNEEGRELAIPLSYRYSPPITSISLHTHCQGFVLEQLAEPPYPLTHLKSLEIHHTDQQQKHLNSVATKYQDAITTLKFSAHSTLGSDIPPHIGIYSRLDTLILGKLELFAAYPLSFRSGSIVPSFAWVTATITYINSRLTRLVFEIAVTEERDLNVICWEDVDAFLDAREQFRGLKSVEVIFVDTTPTTITAKPELLPPGIDLKEHLMKRMRITVRKGLMKCSSRGLRTLW